ncbi:response regulator [Actinoplanes sp. NPDC026623]|uniref:response regulator transcription factor n=1 Tax=Actinoplanes sp. NPDC026623 TaxID=3155610 RepID=UPI0033EECD83
MSTILLVEDDPDIRHLVAGRLTDAGFDVVGAADGPAALNAARERPPDLVLLAVRMPALSGIDVCRELRAGPLAASVPIIMLTARLRQQDLDQGYAAGATGHIIKPFSPAELRERVEAALARVGS